jgi:hypothetical protein
MNLVQELYEDNVTFLNDMIRLAYATLDGYGRLFVNFMRPINPEHLTPQNRGGEVEIDRIQEKGSKYLSILYGLSEGSQSRSFDMYEIGKILGYEPREVDFIVVSLCRSELISRDKVSGKISITPYGIMTINGDINVGYAPIH